MSEAGFAQHPSHEAHRHRTAFHHARTSLGVTGHWLHMVAVLSPVVIGEVVKDAEQRWRWTRLASVGTAVLTEGLYTHRLHKEQKAREAAKQDCPGASTGPAVRHSCRA